MPKGEDTRGAGSKRTSVRRVALCSNSDFWTLEYAKNKWRNMTLGLQLGLSRLSHAATGHEKTRVLLNSVLEQPVVTSSVAAAPFGYGNDVDHFQVSKTAVEQLLAASSLIERLAAVSEKRRILRGSWCSEVCDISCKIMATETVPHFKFF